MNQAVEGTEAAMSEGAGNESKLIDLSNVDENAGFPVLPRGMYDAAIDDCTYGLSQRSGNPMWTIVFEIEDHVPEFAGQKLFFHLPFTDKMKGRVKKFLVRVAPEIAAAPFDPEEVVSQGLLIGKRAKLRVDIRKYEGEDRNNVRDVLPPENQGGEAGFLG